MDRYEFYKWGLETVKLTVNDIREFEGLKPIADGDIKFITIDEQCEVLDGDQINILSKFIDNYVKYDMDITRRDVERLLDYAK